jgi:hypothetical protein
MTLFLLYKTLQESSDDINIMTVKRHGASLPEWLKADRRIGMNRLLIVAIRMKPFFKS